jgi:soluble lytic murein transglycosylase
MLDRAHALRVENRHEDALVLLEAVYASAPPDSTVEELRLAHARMDARQYGPAREMFAKVLGPPETCTGAPADLFDYALTTARAGDYATADAIYRRLQNQHPTSKEADFASFKLGYMHYDAGRWKEARAELLAHVERRPTSKHLEEALWFATRAAWRDGDRATAVADLDRLTKLRPQSSLVPGAQYWKARALGLDGDADGERTALEQLLRTYPTSGYAWYAAHRLGRRFEPQKRVARPTWPEEMARRSDVRTAEALLAAGFRPEARAVLSGLSREARGNRERALATAHALIVAGDYKGGRTLAQPFCNAPWKGGDPVAQQACTPMPEAGIVSAVAERYALDPLLPYGIMNAESALDPTVTSIAGARGLMQIMPAELPRLHEAAFAAGTADPDDLYLAPYNAAIGTTELGLKSKSLAGALSGTSVPAVVASYNGGEDAVRRWLGAWPDGQAEFDEFAEDVGYTETRQYVRRVLGFVMEYRWVYGDSGEGRGRSPLPGQPSPHDR